MDANFLENAAHSANVRIRLRLNGHVMPVAQLGPDFLVLKEPFDHPPDVGDIEMSIDGREIRWRVDLVDGVKSQVRKTRIARCPGTNGTT